MRLFKSLLALALSLGLILGTASIAQANSAPIDPEVGGGYASLEFGNFRYPGTGCYNHTGYLGVFSDDDYAYDDWTASVDINVVSNGQVLDSFYDTKEFSGEYTLDTTLCRNVDPTGTYSVEGSIEFHATVPTYDPGCDCTYDEYISRTVYLSDTFTVSAPLTSSISAAKSGYGAHGWKVAGTAKYNGYGWAGKRVYFQVYRNGAWRNITSKLTSSVGRANFYYTPASGPAKGYRLYTTASNGVSAKATAKFYLKRR